MNALCDGLIELQKAIKNPYIEQFEKQLVFCHLIDTGEIGGLILEVNNYAAANEMKWEKQTKRNLKVGQSAMETAHQCSDAEATLSQVT